MKFSEKYGYSSLPIIQREKISDELANRLWNILSMFVLKRDWTGENQSFIKKQQIFIFIRIWDVFLKYPIDELDLLDAEGEHNIDEPLSTIKNWFFQAVWYRKFDLIEFCVEPEQTQLTQGFNKILKEEYSAYRFIDKKLVELTSEEEVKEIETAILAADKFKSVKTHLSASIESFSDKSGKQYRNSIKESISAVEALLKIITQNDNIKFSSALDEIEKKYNIHGSFKVALSKLFGYTSDTGGIRHSLIEGGDEVVIEDARFMLVTCSAFVNYLIDKTQVKK